MASFRKHANGSWEYRIRYKDKNSNKYKEKSKRGFKTKKEAQLAAAQIETDIEYYGFANDGKESISEYFSKWLEIYKKPNVKPITYSLQERNVRLNILPQWGNLKLKDITRTKYQKWINELRDKYSEGTVRRIHSIMNTALNDAVHEFRILRENPVTRIKIPKETKNNKEIKFFTVDQLEKFLNQVKESEKFQIQTLNTVWLGLDYG